MFLSTIAFLVLGQSGPVTTPSNFLCKHCGKKIVIKAQADLKKKCTVCKCGKTNAECKPGSTQ